MEQHDARQPQVITPARGPCSGELITPPDRWLSHLALGVGALALGPTAVLDPLDSPEVVVTRRILAQLGVVFSLDEEGWLVISRRNKQLRQPDAPLDLNFALPGSMLAVALLAALPGSCILLNAAPHPAWEDISNRLAAFGARLEVSRRSGTVTLEITGGRLRAVEQDLEPLEQWAVELFMLVALQAAGTSRLRYPGGGANHLERLVKQMGGSVRHTNDQLIIRGQQNIHPRHVKLPGDMAVAAPLILLATLVPGSELKLSAVGCNPGRMGLIKTLSRHGASIERQRDWQFGSEPVSDLLVRHALLDCLNVAPNQAPMFGDDFLLAVLAATQVEGTSHLKAVEWNQLRQVAGQPGTDVLAEAASFLCACGARVEYRQGGFQVAGPTRLSGVAYDCRGDSRLAVLALAAAQLAGTPSELRGLEILDFEYPGLRAILSQG
jgi:3-phosphoshikimate 1-carboxyvinyltransferase